VARSYAAGRGEAGVIGVAGAEKNFVGGAVLCEKAFEVGFKAGVGPGEGLEERERWGEAGAGGERGEGAAAYA